MSIQAKALILVLAILTLAFGTGIGIAVVNQRQGLLDAADARLQSNTAMLRSVLETIMLSGLADLMIDALEELQQVQGFEEIRIYRTDGSEAFTFDDPDPQMMQMVAGLPAFRDALSTREPVRVQNRADTTIEYYSPIVAREACFDCHDPAEPIRGVEYVKVSYASVVESIQRASTVLVVFLGSVALLSGILLILFFRRFLGGAGGQLS